MKTGLCTLTLLLLTPATVLANPVTCRLGDLERGIEVVYSAPGQAVPCEVIYDKSAEGSMETLWRAYNEAGYCEEKAAGLAAKLTGLGWHCASAVAEELLGEEALPEAEPAAAAEPPPDPQPAQMPETGQHAAEEAEPGH